MWRCRGTMSRSCNPSRKSGTYEGERDNPQCDRCKSTGSRRFSDGCGYRRAFSRRPLSRFGRCRCARPDQGLAFSKQSPPEISRDGIKSVEPHSGSHLALMSAKTEAGSSGRVVPCSPICPAAFAIPGLSASSRARTLWQAGDCQQCALSMRDASREFDR